MGYMFDKHFTLAEANALIPAVRMAFQKIQRIMNPESDSAPGAAGNGHGNGNGNGHHAHHQLSPEERVAKANQLLEAVTERGIVIQDWQRGLIDFPHLLGEREVFLCYEMADGSEIQYYHDIDAGYAGRQPLE
jgi:hypothetical protein